MRGILLLLLVAAGVCCDFKYDRIPNQLIAVGLALGVVMQIARLRLIWGILIWCLGISVPLLLGILVYYFRMMGAGDIKLLCMAGSFLGPFNAIACIVASLLAGAVYAVLLLWKRGNLKERAQYFREYIEERIKNRDWKPYLTEEDLGGKLHFSIAVLAAVVLYVGGVY